MEKKQTHKDCSLQHCPKKAQPKVLTPPLVLLSLFIHKKCFWQSQNAGTKIATSSTRQFCVHSTAVQRRVQCSFRTAPSLSKKRLERDCFRTTKEHNNTSTKKQQKREYREIRSARTLGYNVPFPYDEHRTLDKPYFE